MLLCVVYYLFILPRELNTGVYNIVKWKAILLILGLFSLEIYIKLSSRW